MLQEINISTCGRSRQRVANIPGAIQAVWSIWATLFPTEDLAMEPTPKISRDESILQMRQKMAEIPGQVAHAIHQAPPGYVISGSEEKVRDLFADLGMQAYEKGLQMRINAAEAALPPSEGRDLVRPSSRAKGERRMSTIQLELGPADRGADRRWRSSARPRNKRAFATSLPRKSRGDRCCGSRASSRCGESVPVIARYDRNHPGVIETFGGGAEFRLWIPGTTSGAIPTWASSSKARFLTLRVELSQHSWPKSSHVAVRRGTTKPIRREYLLFGIREYWIVDPLMRQVTVLSRTGERWAEQVARDEEPIPSQVLPGPECPTSALWAGVVADDPGE